MDAAQAINEYRRLSEELNTLPGQMRELDLNVVELTRMEREAKKRLDDVLDALNGVEASLMLKVNAEPGKSNKEEREAKVAMLMREDAGAIRLNQQKRKIEGEIESYQYEISRQNAEKSALVARNNNAGFQSRNFLGLMMRLASYAEMPVVSVNGYHSEELAL